MSKPVSLIKCNSYDEIAVQEAVQQTVDLIGGIESFVKPNQKVLLKVNLLRAGTPNQAISTHPAVLKAVIKLVQQAGGRPIIGDSPGGPFNASWMRTIYWRNGIAQVAEETGADLNWDFDQVMLSHPEGNTIKALEVGTYVTTADVVISLPKLKTHSFMRFTGATKNLFGVIPGAIKVGYHAKFPEPDSFADMLIDILTLIKPAFSLMDGITGMDGNGPSAGSPFQANALLASADSIALDVIAASLVNISPLSIHPIHAAAKRGLTTGKASDIQILGNSFDDFDIQNFRLPETGNSSGKMFTFITKMVKDLVVAAPKANDRCIGCGICANNCPVDAITIENKKAVMDLSTCIRCYCCHEMCPELAIDLKKAWLGKLIT